METRYWHGENATILYNDGEDVTFIVGNYGEPEVARIKRMLDLDSPEISEYGDAIVTATADEWNEQNR